MLIKTRVCRVTGMEIKIKHTIDSEVYKKVSKESSNPLYLKIHLCFKISHLKYEDDIIRYKKQQQPFISL